MTEKRKREQPEVVEEILQEAQRKNITDVLGSWTGVPWDEGEIPVQDVDDL